MVDKILHLEYVLENNMEIAKFVDGNIGCEILVKKLYDLNIEGSVKDKNSVHLGTVQRIL